MECLPLPVQVLKFQEMDNTMVYHIYIIATNVAQQDFAYMVNTIQTEF